MKRQEAGAMRCQRDQLYYSKSQSISQFPYFIIVYGICLDHREGKDLKSAPVPSAAAILLRPVIPPDAKGGIVVCNRTLTASSLTEEGCLQRHRRVIWPEQVTYRDERDIGNKLS